MKQTLKIGIIQTQSGIDIAHNIANIAPLITNAANDGAELISLPEVVNLMQIDRKQAIAQIKYQDDDIFLKKCCELSRELGIWLHIGSLIIKVKNRDKPVNRSFMINDKGKICATYDKIHMFDVDLENGESYRESSMFDAGNHAVIIDSPWGIIGMTICYDLRFPYLHRKLAQAGARLILCPAAFTKKTGKAHWHILLRARAIENSCFIAAAAQNGTHEDGRETYGHSLIASPWGDVIADAGTTKSITIATIKFNAVDDARSMIPSLKYSDDQDIKISKFT